MDEPLTEEAQSTLRSESGQLVWIARKDRHDALYDASESAQTFETIGDPIDFD